jgi:uncharacterized protein (TIGR03085 family)
MSYRQTPSCPPTLPDTSDTFLWLGPARPGYDPGVTDFAPIERSALADLMADVGPDAQTLCEGWTTRDLAAHLVVRGSLRLDAAAGILVPAFAGHLHRVQEQIAAQPWDRLLSQARRRPRWAVIGDETVNLVEYYVHHEDVRRAQPDWQPRAIAPEESRAIWPRVAFQAKMALRRTPASVSVTAPGLSSLTGGRGGPTVTISGPAEELVLFFLGRQAHSLVEISGPEEIISRMRTAHYGI